MANLVGNDFINSNTKEMRAMVYSSLEEDRRQTEKKSDVLRAGDGRGGAEDQRGVVVYDCVTLAATKKSC